MKKLLTLFCSIICSLVHAQLNRLHNGSFEQNSRCPDNLDQIKYATYWDAIDTNYVLYDSACLAMGDQYAEYINTCSSNYECTAPHNHRFNHYPRTGFGMTQVAFYYDMPDTIFHGWNYIQGRLISHLISGQSYCVTFFVTKEQASKYSINKIGAYLDDGTIDTTHNPAVPQTQYTPQILDTNIISDTLNWTKIQGSFVANGTEKFITIGVFFDTGHVTHINNIYIGADYGLYLTDDVSVVPSDATADAGRDTTIHQGDTTTIGPVNGDGLPYVWYKLGGTTAIDSGGNIRVHPDSTTSYVAVMDLCGHITRDTVKVTVKPVGVDNLTIRRFDNLAIFPNPSAGFLTIEHAAGCEVVFYDVIGREMKHLSVVGDKEEVDISALVSGVYFMHVIDPLSGQQVVRKLVKE